MMFAPSKDGELPIVITQNVICANQKTECFANDSLCAHTTLDVTCFPHWSGVISSVK